MQAIHLIAVAVVIVLIVLLWRSTREMFCGETPTCGAMAFPQLRCDPSVVEPPCAVKPEPAPQVVKPADSEAVSSDATQTVKNAAGAGDHAAAGAAAAAEHVEYYESVKDSDDVTKVLDCTCDDSSGFTFAKNDYGTPGMDYNSFVLSQSVDQQVVDNHAQFVEDRRNVNARGGDFTGRTWTPDGTGPGNGVSSGFPTWEGQGNLASNWWGLWRPYRVDIANPTQLTQDEDDDGYRTKRWCR